MVRYVKHDPVTGDVLQVVTRPEQGLSMEDNTVVVADNLPIDPRRHRIRNGKITDRPVGLDEIRVAINLDFERTDRYFLSDALNNIDAVTQKKWEQYREKLRAAYKLTNPAAVIAALPNDVKGFDAFAWARKRPTE